MPGASPDMAYEAIAYCLVCIFLAYGLWNLRTFAWYIWVIYHSLYVLETTTIPVLYLLSRAWGGVPAEGPLGFRIVLTIVALLIIRYACKCSTRRLFRIPIDSRRPIYVVLGVSLAIALVSLVGLTLAVQSGYFTDGEFTIDDTEMLQSWEESCFELSEKDFEIFLGDFLDAKSAHPGSPVTTFHIYHGDTVEYSWEFRDSSMVEYRIVYRLGDEGEVRTRAESMFREFTEAYGSEASTRSESYLWRVGTLKVNLFQDDREITVLWTRWTSP